MSVAGVPREPSANDDLDDILPTLTAAFAATAAQHDRDGSFPHENFRLLHQHGLLALTAPRIFGGREADLATALKVIEAVARGEPATALVLTMQYIFHATMRGVSAFPPDLATRVATSARDEGALINAFRVEPELGTPARGGMPASIARQTSEGWSLSGRKMYSTGSPGLTWMMVWARTDEPEPRVGYFLVHRDAPGWRIDETWDHTGLRASGSHDVVFEDAPVPAGQTLTLHAPSAPPPPHPSMSLWAPVLIAGIYNAVGEAGREWFMRWAMDRKPANLGAALSTLPRFQELVGVMDGLLLQNRVLLDAATAGTLNTPQCALVKHLVTENTISALEKALAVTGNPGLSRHNDLQRHFRDALCGRIHQPQADMILTGAGKASFAALAAR